MFSIYKCSAAKENYSGPNPQLFYILITTDRLTLAESINIFFLSNVNSFHDMFLQSFFSFCVWICRRHCCSHKHRETQKCVKMFDEMLCENMYVHEMVSIKSCMIENGVNETCMVRNMYIYEILSTKFYRNEKFVHKPSIYSILYN